MICEWTFDQSLRQKKRRSIPITLILGRERSLPTLCSATDTFPQLCSKTNEKDLDILTRQEEKEKKSPHPTLCSWLLTEAPPGSLLHTLDTDWSSIQCTFSTQNMHFLCEGRISYIYCAKLPLYPFWAVARISWWPRHWQYNDTEYQYGTLFHFICSWYFPSRTNVILGCLCFVLHIIGFETDRCALHHSGENRRNRIINWTMCLWDGWGGITQWGIRKKRLSRTDSTDVIYTFQIKDVIK